MLWLCYVSMSSNVRRRHFATFHIFYMYIRPNQDDSESFFSIIVVVRQVVKCPIQKREKTEEGRRRRGRDPAAHSLSAMPVGGHWSGTLPLAASVLRIAILTNPYKTASYKCDGAQNGIATPPSSPSHSHNFTSFLGLHLRVL